MKLELFFHIMKFGQRKKQYEKMVSEIKVSNNTFCYLNLVMTTKLKEFYHEEILIKTDSFPLYCIHAHNRQKYTDMT